MENVSLLIKPASGLCNMDCEYCFYHDLVDHREVKSYGLMTETVLEQVVSRAYENASKSVSFMFQGGEPMLIGLPFYETLIDFVRKYNVNNITTNYAIQTNGTLITEDFAQFFKTNNFLVGISIDGPSFLHDHFRVMNNSDSSFEQVTFGLDLLRKYAVDYNILSVVTSLTVEHTETVYEYLSNLDTLYLQFIPCIDSFDNINSKFHIDNNQYSDFLIRLFDIWENDFYKGKRLSIRYFDDLVKMIIGYIPSTCMLNGSCMIQNVIESDGSIYPCDFYVLDGYKIGDVFSMSFDEVMNHPIAKDFVINSRVPSNDCKRCRYYQLCKGGCRRYKEPYDNIEHAKTRFCEAFTKFLDSRLNNLVKIAQTLINEQK